MDIIKDTIDITDTTTIEEDKESLNSPFYYSTLKTLTVSVSILSGRGDFFFTDQ